MYRVLMFFKLLPLAISLRGGFLPFARTIIRVVRNEGVNGLRLRVIRTQKSQQFLTAKDKQGSKNTDLYQISEVDNTSNSLKVSIIVPNYNHKHYLRQRLESIYNQTYENFEVILLDDCSTDGSQEILLEYAERFSGKTKCYFNEVNSGGVFNQWKKGLELATGDLVWIAESDDYCTTNLLAELVKYFANQAIMLAFCRSDFVVNEPPVRIWTTEGYWEGTTLSYWKDGFIKSAHWLVNNGWGIKNIIPNVSSAVFRHPGSMDIFASPEWTNLQLCGDWIFYLSLIRGGLVAYDINATNFYRQHASGTSINIQKSNNYYREHEVVARYLVSLYRLDHDVLNRQREELYSHWEITKNKHSLDEFNSLYNIDNIQEFAKKRKPNLVMVAYALVAGGGETFPILLANLFKAYGYSVTLFNANYAKTDPGVRKMLNQNIPLLEVAKIESVVDILADIGAEIVHTHYACMDTIFAACLAEKPEIKQVVTLHGMYEMMEPQHLASSLAILNQKIDSFVYIAEKNLAPFSKSFRDTKKFTQINNTLPVYAINPILRSELGIEAEDFVLCLVSRAIPEKGWEEAIQAVIWARNNSKRKIHLLMLGKGLEYERLKAKTKSDFVHFLGFRANTRDYFAMADVGFLPSRFKGECSPLVLIDCILSGRPMIASNIGEIATMLSAKTGLAGEIFDLQDWAVPVETVGKIIANLANNQDYYELLKRRAPEVASKFDVKIMIEKYDQVYQGCMTH